MHQFLLIVAKRTQPDRALISQQIQETIEEGKRQRRRAASYNHAEAGSNCGVGRGFSAARSVLEVRHASSVPRLLHFSGLAYSK